MQHHYTFVTNWEIDAPLDTVWDHIIHIETWPSWWKGVKQAKILNNENNTPGVGSTILTTWKSWLPYSITFTLTITEVVKGERLSASAIGDLVGTGVWDFSEENGKTEAVYTWDVSTTKWWMNVIAPLARPLFAHAHDVVMGWGEEGLRKLVATERE